MIDWESKVVAPCTKVFGGNATFTHKGGLSYGVTVVFDSAYMELSMDEHGVEVTTTHPVAGGPVSQFKSPPKQGDTIFIFENSKTYAVKEPRPDSKGHVLLILNYLSG